MTATPSPQPIFIHALFRTGSTYMFEVFRRLGSQYMCFQEPLHEIALHAKTDTAILNDPQDTQKANVLRHPPLSRSYFSELYEVADACLPHLQERDIYDGYFGTDTRPRESTTGSPLSSRLLPARLFRNAVPLAALKA